MPRLDDVLTTRIVTKILACNTPSFANFTSSGLTIVLELDISLQILLQYSKTGTLILT